MKPVSAFRIRVSGRVQGVGFRPFVARLAHEFGLTGWVRNVAGEVDIHAEGPPERLDAFVAALTGRAPPLARPEPPRVAPAQALAPSGFAIRGSAEAGRADIHIPPDHFVCADCLAEMADPRERRYRYPFINCTQCGPRYTIIDRLPYDRPHTAMADFPLCPACAAQYSDPRDRRYHAQPLACPGCGPRLTFRPPGAADSAGNEPALSACLEALRAGALVAVKGVGGYHLMTDARNEAAVRRLRDRKRRPGKPLAVLVPWIGADGLDGVRAVAAPTAEEADLLRSPLRPIVLVRKRARPAAETAGEGADAPAPLWELAAGIAPGLAEVGLMLPYSPLHHLLAEGFGAPLVATSANLSGEPVLTEAAEVETRLGTVAEAFLHHDRPIRRPADDAVYRRSAGRLRPLRLGRGVAPLELRLPFRLEAPLLAAGSDLKNTIALAFDDRVVVSPHIGDLASARSGDIFARTVADLCRLYAVEPAALVADAHPDYVSTRWALAQGLPVRRVFHHHAHAAAVAGEFGLDGEMLVFAWDGTGYGEDGTVWGGEALLGRPGAWRRVGSLRPFRLPGGDRVSREPWRSAAALCWEAGLHWPAAPPEARLLRQVWEKRLNCPVASSAGRLFDAAAALLGLVQRASHEGQAGMALEALSGATDDFVPLPLERDTEGVWRLDWAPLLPLLLDGRRPPGERGSRFHASLAAGLAALAGQARAETGVNRVGLTGGVFQNRLLAEAATAALAARGFRVRIPELVPVNDAGLSYGQVVEAARRC
jgi:hydrogenase maturation protein HypF